MSTRREFPVPAPSKAAWGFIIALGILLPVLVLVPTVFHMPGDGSNDRLVLGGVLAFVVLVGGAMAALMCRRSVALEGATLVVKAAMYTRRTPLAAIDAGAARVVDLREHTELKPFWKNNGYGLPGFRAGYFRLRNRERAFCLLTDPARVAVLPVPGERMLLLSTTRATELVAAVREARTPRV